MENNVKIVKTDGFDPLFHQLILKLDAGLTENYGILQEQYQQFNHTDDLKLVVLLKVEEAIVGCGALKEITPEKVELKRVYVDETYRGHGYGKNIVNELMNISMDLGYDRMVLETGAKQKAAIAVYRSLGFKDIEKFGPYKEMENSICMGKNLIY